MGVEIIGMEPTAVPIGCEAQIGDARTLIITGAHHSSVSAFKESVN